VTGPAPLATESQAAVHTEAASLGPPSERILVVRLGAMGDILHGMPAIAALRSANPKVKIGWLVEERWAELLCSHEEERLSTCSQRKPLVDWVHTANFSVWRGALFSGKSWREMRQCLHEVRAMHYDVALDLQGAIRSAIAARLSGADSRIGSARPREAPARLLYTLSTLPEGRHVVEHALSLASSLAGKPLPHVDTPLPHDLAIEAWAEQLHTKLHGRPLAILNPGAGWGAKCWPAESYGSVAKALSDRGMAVLVNHGPREEDLARAVSVASCNQALPLKCSVGELIALTRRTSLFIGGDTGPMHLAASLHVPVVALFGPTQPERNGPYGTRSIVLRSPQSVFNSSHTNRPDEGLVSIEPTAVIEAADRLLGGVGA